jgi:hypothetical protein
MKHRFTIAIPIVMLGALAFVSSAAAQRGISAKSAPMGRAASGRSFGMGGRSAFRPAYPLRSVYRNRGRGWGWGWGYLPYPDYDDTSDFEPAITEVLPPERLIQPIVLEKQGDEWVQVGGYSHSPAQPAPPNAVEATQRRSTVPSANEAPEPPLPAAVLVFRDGHQEEVESYTIIGSTLYTKANYWTSGSWTRQIEIANLDVPATLKVNQERGSKFRLPSGPQEVMVRP